MDDTNVFDHSVFEEMHCNEKEQEQAHYHFALGEIVYYTQQYGLDQVMTDIYDYIEIEKQQALAKAKKGYLNPALRTYDGKLV